MDDTRCPSCGQTDLDCEGRLPDADCFAGRDLDPPLPGGSLFACKGCGLHFRWPRLSKLQADTLYSQGEAQHWSSPVEARPDWQLARQWVSQLSQGGPVLDIACFDGKFLSSLDHQHQRFGIEIHPVAAQRARDCGVQIVARDLAELSRIEQQFSVITAFDILEHVHDPSEFLSRVTEALRPGGVAIIGTGNTDAKSWRFMGTDYWYCSNMEHISFINPRWCAQAAEKMNLEVSRIAELSHCHPTLSKICREVTMNVLFRASPRYSTAVRYRYRAWFRPHRRNSRHERPVWFSAKDHLLAAFRKPASQSSCAPCGTMVA